MLNKHFFTFNGIYHDKRFEEDRESIVEKESEVETKEGQKYKVRMVTCKLWSNPKTKRLETCFLVYLEEPVNTTEGT